MLRRMHGQLVVRATNEQDGHMTITRERLRELFGIDEPKLNLVAGSHRRPRHLPSRHAYVPVRPGRPHPRLPDPAPDAWPAPRNPLRTFARRQIRDRRRRNDARPDLHADPAGSAFCGGGLRHAGHRHADVRGRPRRATHRMGARQGAPVVRQITFRPDAQREFRRPDLAPRNRDDVDSGARRHVRHVDGRDGQLLPRRGRHPYRGLGPPLLLRRLCER